MNTASKENSAGGIWLILAILFSCFLALYNSVAMNIAIPTFITYFHADVGTVQWIMISYTLMMGVMSPTAGYFSDRFSCRNVYAAAMLGLAIASLISGFCSSIYVLIVVRLVQGALAAFIMPCSMMLVYQFIAPQKRATYLTVQTMSVSAGPGLGPVLGGFLLTTFNWRVALWINVPLALIAAWGIYTQLPYETRPTSDKLDYVGFSSVIMGTILFLLSFNMVTKTGIGHPGFWIMLIAGTVLIALFISRCVKSARPVLNFTILNQKDYTLTLIINCCFSMALCLVPFVLSIYLQTLRGFTAFQSGLVLLIPAIFSVGGAPIAQYMYARIDSKIIITISCVLVALGSVVLAFTSLTSSMLFVVFWLCVRYFGLGIHGMPLTDYGMSALPKELSGHGSALLNWFKSMITSFSLSVFTMIFSLRVMHYNETMDYALAQMKGIDDLFLYSGLIIAVSIVLCLLLKSNQNLRDKE